MKKSLLLFLAVFLYTASASIYSQSQKYSRVKIHTDEAGLKRLAAAGVAVDHGNYRKGVFFESDFSATEILKIQSLGFNYEINIDDVSKHYRLQNPSVKTQNIASPVFPQDSMSPQNTAFSAPRDIVSPPHQLPTANYPLPAASCQSPSASYLIPSNFSLGTMGGFYKYNEFLAHIDSMSAKFPNLITAKQPIDTFHSIEGKNIFWLKISDNPSMDENEPEVLYTALHHAREPASLSQLIFYMWYLLENYGTNPEVTYLVDHAEMYFIPMVNPDGYIYNQITYPGGGGLWRKNRRPNGGNEFGVDLNRNYGYFWGHDNVGSSPDSTSDTYRGSAEFSEPETQAVKFFCENHSFKLALNYHTYGNLFIYPWGFEENIYTPDSAYFVNYAKEATRDNFFSTGTGNQTVGYVTNGDSDDWMYGEQTAKNKIISVTPEAGPSDLGFWPPASEIVNLCIDNMTQNLTMAHLALKYAKVNDTSPLLITGTSGYFSFSIQNLGLDTPALFTISIIPVSSGFQNVGAPKIFSSLPLAEEKLDSIAYSLDSAIQSGTELTFILNVNNGLYDYRDTVTKIYGIPTLVLAENANDLDRWNTNKWGLSNEFFYSADSSITDSPGSNYQNEDTAYIELIQPIDLTTTTDAFLTFRARWEIEPGWDFAQALASADNGATWEPLCGKYTKRGNSNQAEGLPLYDGMQHGWVKEEISLKNFSGSSIKLRFQLISDGWLNYDGFYFDELRIETLDTSSVPVSEKYGNKIFISQNIPNPAAGTISFNYSIPADGMLLITDALGKTVQVSHLSYLTSHISFPLPLPPGIYFYQVVSENYRSEVKRLAVVR